MNVNTKINKTNKMTFMFVEHMFNVVIRVCLSKASD